MPSSIIDLDMYIEQGKKKEKIITIIQNQLKSMGQQ